MKPLRLQSRAPTRIDLCGGTLDIWPLYLFLERPETINLGISLFAEVTLELGPPPPGRAPGVVLRSADQGFERSFGWDELPTLTPEPAIALPFRLLRYFAAELQAEGRLDRSAALTLSTRAQSPAGAGLGGSSTLSIALVGALASWARGGFDKARDGERFIEIVRDTETTVIAVPAGLQDYYGAMYGGLQRLRWQPAVHHHAPLQHATVPLAAGLAERVTLFYSGQSRNSGINNWALFKAFIDGDARVRGQFAEIARATHDLGQALHAADWQGVGAAIAREWETRRALAAGISTPEIDAAFESARALGATAGKICGAGGGGCFFVYEPSGDPELRRRLVAQASGGLRHLPYQPALAGLEVWAPSPA